MLCSNVTVSRFFNIFTRLCYRYIGVGLVLKQTAQAGGRRMFCEVSVVRSGSPAAAAGVAVGDVLLAVDGIRVEKRLYQR